MTTPQIEFLREICAAPSVSGFEQQAQMIIASYFKPLVDRIESDIHSNVIGIINEGCPVSVLLSAHCDEIGFLVNDVTKNGFLRLVNTFGIDPNIQAGQRVYVYNKAGRVPGVIGKKVRTACNDQERRRALQIMDIFVDIGAVSRQQAMEMVAIGDPVLDADDLELLANNLVASRNLDDKIGIYTIFKILHKLDKSKLNCTVYVVSSTQEEIGMRGIRPVAFRLKPSIGIAIDVMDATDYPTIDSKTMGTRKVGSGPVLVRGGNVNPVIGERLIETASRYRIPHQIAAKATPTGTDANVMQISAAGIATALTYIPNRYMHTPSEVSSLDDVENAATLLARFLEELPVELDCRPLKL